MKKRAIDKSLLAFVATVVFCVSQMAPANADANDPLAVKMSLMTAKTVSLGEPIILEAQIANTNGQTLAVHLGRQSTEWYSISLTDAGGLPVAAVPDKPSPEQGGFQVTAERPIPPGDYVTNYIVVTQHFVLPHPGQYQLTVHVHVPYAQVDSDEAAPSVWKKVITEADTTQAQDFTFPVTVTAADPAYLCQRAAQLQQEISAHPYGPLYNTLTTALFSMPEADAVDCWRSLADKPSMASEVYAKQLERLATPTAADILAEMLSNPGLHSEQSAYIGQCINEMYNAGDAPLRQHIKEIAAAHSLTLPETIPIPQVSD